MIYRKLGSSDLDVSIIGYGAWGIGGPPFWKNKDEKTSLKTIEKAFTCGINLFDTAAVYGLGYSEELIGKALKSHRKEVIIATKCGLRWDYNGSIINNLKRESVLEEIDLSLERLQTDYVDLYQVHWPDPGTPLEETMNALKEILDSGKARYIGVSNFSATEIKESLQFVPVVSLQPPYNIFNRKIEKETLPLCIEKNIGILAYSPLASGILTGKYSKDSKFKDWRGKFGDMFKKERYYDLIDKTEKIKEYLSKSGGDIIHFAINWVISGQGVTSALVGAHTPEQVEHNVKALDWTFSEEDREFIETHIQ